MKISSLLFLPIAIISVSACTGGSHLISDTQLRKEMIGDYEKRKIELSPSNDLFKFTDTASISDFEREAMQFLCAYMPLCDLGDYDAEYFLGQVKSSVKARSLFNWGDKIPEEIFRHFVLPPRVNNENLDTARQVMLRELKERVEGLSMYEAALEVNHWCHEKVTYRGSDTRTSAPLATMLSGYGRCGEESTFTVAALRAVGLPARQCYTPRWAHTDDNHAWVEVWCDGKWYYLGACEPEPVLNRAWFTAPAGRAMMVHTNVFGKYKGPEERIDFPLYSKINILSNYTKTRRVSVKVTDSDGAPVAGAKVRYLLYNYSEFYPIFTSVSDNRGVSGVTTGFGDLLVYASSDVGYGYTKASPDSPDTLRIALNRSSKSRYHSEDSKSEILSGLAEEYQENIDLVPPPPVNISDTLSAELITNNILRIKQEDSIRTRYTAGFMSRSDAKNFAVRLNLDTSAVAGYIVRSEGNWREIAAYIGNNSSAPQVLNLLSTLSDKDLRDTPSAILESHLKRAVPFNPTGAIPEKVYIEGVLSPVIYYELIRDWRPELNKLADRLACRKNPGWKSIDADLLMRWTIENIKQDDSSNYPRNPLSPAGTLKLRRADRISRDIFFTALCRCFGIPAKFDKATLNCEVYESGRWRVISAVKNGGEEHKSLSTGHLTLDYKGGGNSKPIYWSNYTIAKFTDGYFQALDFEGDPRVSSLPARLELEEGYYRLCTGNRSVDGSVLARNDYFIIAPGADVRREIIIRDTAVKTKIFGKADPSLKSSVICFIDPGKEPTKHLFQELPPFRAQFEKWGGELLFVVPEKIAVHGFDPDRFKGLPASARFITKGGESMLNKLEQSAKRSFTGDYPLIFVINGEGNIVYISEGYRIGLAESITKLLTIK